MIVHLYVYTYLLNLIPTYFFGGENNLSLVFTSRSQHDCIHSEQNIQNLPKPGFHPNILVILKILLFLGVLA